MRYKPSFQNGDTVPGLGANLGAGADFVAPQREQGSDLSSVGPRQAAID